MMIGPIDADVVEHLADTLGGAEDRFAQNYDYYHSGTAVGLWLPIAIPATTRPLPAGLTGRAARGDGRRHRPAHD